MDSTSPALSTVVGNLDVLHLILFVLAKSLYNYIRLSFQPFYLPVHVCDTRIVLIFIGDMNSDKIQ